MADRPFPLATPLAARLDAALDMEHKLGRALEALGPVAGRDVVLLGDADAPIGRALAELGARLRPVAVPEPLRIDAADGTADVIVSPWSAFRGVEAADLSEVDRVLRPGGRLLVVHDYGRDDVSRIQPDRIEYGTWTRVTGPFLAGGFRVRVVHCFWTFESIEAATAFLGEAFGPAGAAVAATLRRPRLSWNVAIYQHTRGGDLPA